MKKLSPKMEECLERIRQGDDGSGIPLRTLWALRDRGLIYAPYGKNGEKLTWKLTDGTQQRFKVSEALEEIETAIAILGRHWEARGLSYDHPIGKAGARLGEAERKLLEIVGDR